MSENTNEDILKMQEKLDYIGLDIENIPEFLKEYKYLNFRPLKSYEENGYKIYKYIPISKIQIMLTPTNRLDYIEEKYSKASPLYSYLVPKDEKDIIRHTTFLKMLETVQISGIEKVEEEQEKLSKDIPFCVKYKDNYLWQIYYSDTTDQYFMMVPTEDLDYSAFFYLLKEQIKYSKTKEDKLIYVPISYQQHSGKYLSKSEITDIEKYLWLFTKEWPMIYEVYDKDSNMTMQVVGKCVIYEKVESYYRIKLETEEKAVRFYKLLKAIFIMQTVLGHYYQFQTKIDDNGGLEFYCKKEKITYDMLSDFIEREYLNIEEKIKTAEKDDKELETKLAELKEISLSQDKEYLDKERQITTFLECKKTFLGKVKYFFKSKKKIKSKDEKVSEEEKNEPQKQEEAYIETKKEFYTIEDLVTCCSILDKKQNIIKNNRQDIRALEIRIETMKTKINNANLYLQEIDEHKKSIFEFWKFTNKDKNLELAEGEKKEEIKEENQPKLQKVFDYKDDFDEFGEEIDRLQKNHLTKDETDAINICDTNELEILNLLRKGNITEDQLQKSLEQLKQEGEQERIFFLKEDFDIFGSIAEDRTKIKVLGNSRHRETKKDKLKILDINKNSSIEKYKSKLNNIEKNIEKGIEKIKTPFHVSIYKAGKSDLNLNDMQVFHIDPQNAIETLENEKEINLYRVNLQQNMNAVFFSNIIYYDNFNNTLPLGMNVSDKVLIDSKMFVFGLKNKIQVKINEITTEQNFITQIVNIYEYEVKERAERKNDK